MAQIFVFGASSTYGSGGSQGGWADMIKRQLHQQMFGPDGHGEQYQVHIFAKPGATIEFVQQTYADQLKHYRDPGKVVAVVSVGLNNIKAHNSPTNFVSTTSQYQQAMHQLLSQLRPQVDAVIAVGYTPVDETKMPLVNELYGRSYFTNARIADYNSLFERVCDQSKIRFVPVNQPSDEWLSDCLYQDGLHPNDRGHQLIFEAVMPEIEQLLA